MVAAEVELEGEGGEARRGQKNAMWVEREGFSYAKRLSSFSFSLMEESALSCVRERKSRIIFFGKKPSEQKSDPRCWKKKAPSCEPSERKE